MTTLVLTKTVRAITKFTLVLPSGHNLIFDLYDGMPKEDIDFIERIIQLGIEELKEKK